MSTHKILICSRLCSAILALFLALNVAGMHAQDRPVVIAHRGACGYLPEHTLEAVSMAHAMQVDFIEQDVVLTKDDVPVVLHDIHLDTVTDVAEKFPHRAREDSRFYAIDFSLEEIKQLTVHERVSLKTGKAVFPKRFDASKRLFRVPTLAEEIELIEGLNNTTNRDVGIYVEIKKPAWHREQGKDTSKIVLDALAKYGYQTKEHNVYLQCFDPKETRRIREELKSNLKLVQLIADNGWKEAAADFDQMRTKEGIAEITEYADGIGPWMPHILKPIEGADPEKTNLVQWAHEKGLVVHPFTFRKDALPAYAESFEGLMKRFFDLGIDGLFSDFPDLSVASRNEFQPKTQELSWEHYNKAPRSLVEQHARLGVANAEVELGRRFAESKDEVNAAKWYRRSVEQGNSRAQFNLAVLYQFGAGVPKDEAEAVRLFRLAADQGNSFAQINLASMYRDGRGVEKDPDEANLWLAKAKETQVKEAQASLSADKSTEALSASLTSEDVKVFETAGKQELPDQLEGSWAYTGAYSTVYADGYIGELFSDPKREMAKLTIGPFSEMTFANSEGEQSVSKSGHKLTLLPSRPYREGYRLCWITEHQNSLFKGKPGRCWLGKYKIDGDILTFRFPYTCECSRSGLTFNYKRVPK